MADIWFTSDSHFNHANILKFTDWDKVTPIRPGFKNVNDMNEVLIENWNSVVKNGDKVYHLGDVAFGNVADFGPIMRRLNGSKRLLLGNHDKFDIGVYRSWFQKVGVTRHFKESKSFICSHYPMHPDSVNTTRDGTDVYNVHGHIHQNTVTQHGSKVPDRRYINICVEKTNYTPINLDQLLSLMK